MSKDEALKMAIEAMEYNIEWYNIGDKGIDKSEEAINACKEALEQPAQEPVALVYSMQDGYVGQMVVKGIPHKTKLYTHPHQVVPTSTWQGLTDDEIDMLWLSNETTDDGAGEHLTYAHAIEAKLKEKSSV